MSVWFVTVALPLVKKFGPALAVVLCLVLVWMWGHSAGAGKWKTAHRVAADNYNACLADANRAADEVVRLRDAINSQNDAMRELERIQSAEMMRIEEIHQRVLADQVDSYQQAIENARRSTGEDLQCRVEEMSVCEVCDAAWVEVME